MSQSQRTTASRKLLALEEQKGEMPYTLLVRKNHW